MKDLIDRTTLDQDFQKCNAENPNWTPQRVRQLIYRQPSVERGKRAELGMYDDWICPMDKYFAGNATWDEAIDKSIDILNDMIIEEVMEELNKHEAD